jgi:hypothetical protein
MGALTTIEHGLRDALLMAWSVWWALVLGFAISVVVQAWVPRERVRHARGPREGGARKDEGRHPLLLLGALRTHARTGRA